MQYVILDSAGNALASYDDQLDAYASLHAMVAVEPEASEHLAVLGYDDRGMPVGEAVMAIDVPPAVSWPTSSFLVPQLTSGLLREPAQTRTRYVPAGTQPIVAART